MRRKNYYRMWNFAIVVPLLMFVAQLDACTRPSISEESVPGNQENTTQSATANEVLDNSDAFYGTRATVTG